MLVRRSQSTTQRYALPQVLADRLCVATVISTAKSVNRWILFIGRSDYFVFLEGEACEQELQRGTNEEGIPGH